MPNEWLDAGWGYHDTESERLAAELEAAAETPVPLALSAKFLRLANHTVGEHLGDWPRARRLVERVLQGRAADADSARDWISLSVARLMAGDPSAALAAELTALAASGSGLAALLVEARFMLVAALVGSRRTAEAAALYPAALDLARRLGDAAPDRAIAVASANLATELLEAPARTAEAAALMNLAAEASHEFWLRCGDWRNDERGHYLKALVANVSGEPGRALGHVDAALEIIAANGEAPIDVVFLHLTRAHAHRLAGDAPAAAAALAISDAAAAGWDVPGLRSWYAEERARTGAAS